MALILLFTDFDGTITAVPGAKVVFTPFYRSLLINPPEQQYKNILMKSGEEVQRLFIEKFGPYEAGHTAKEDGGFLMTEGAVAFFRELLSNDEVKVHIITRNRDDYIRALFRYHEFTAAEISRLAINCKDYKHVAVTSFLSDYQDIDKVYVLDDDKADFQRMMDAVKHLDADKIVSANDAPGTFMWQSYLQQIQATLQTSVESSELQTDESYQKMKVLGTADTLNSSAEITHFSKIFESVNVGKTDSNESNVPTSAPIRPYS